MRTGPMVKGRNARVGMNRRSLLMGVGALALSQLLLGCGSEEAALRVRLLKGSIPAQLLKAFQRQVKPGTSLEFLAEAQFHELYDLLQTWKQQSSGKAAPTKSSSPFPLPFSGSQKAVPVADVMTLGDYWLAPAIQQGLIQPLPISNLKEWQQLPPLWQSLVRRDRQGNLSEQGDIWAAPYRWGSLMMVYRAEPFKALGWVPKEWSDLWRPELRGKISLLDSPRSVIGLTLKKLGQSVNTNNVQTIAALPKELQTLQQQVKFYSSDAYLQPLLLEDTWLAVGWSTEILPTLKRDHQLTTVVPASGTILTADLWVRPAAAHLDSSDLERFNLLKQWIGFCWQPQIATQLSLLTSMTSPLFAGGNTVPPQVLQANSPQLLSEEVFQRSEFLLPVTDGTIDQYRKLWVGMREGTLATS